MRVYTVHVPPAPSAGAGEAILIKEGFCWPAFFFTVLWALFHRLWLVAAGLLVIAAVLNGLGAVVGLDPVGQLALALGYQTLVGYAANDLRRRSAERAGYVETAVVAGADQLAAEQRYLDHALAGPGGRAAAAA